MRRLTKDEKAFNLISKDYNIKAATARQFDNAEEKHPELYQAFTSFTASPSPLELSFFDEIGITGVNKTPECYKIFEDKSGISQQEANEMMLTAQLFDLHTQIPEIASRIYAETEMYGFFIDGEKGESYALAVKIAKWHSSRKVIDKVKPFVEKYFSHWEKATTKEKKESKEEIKTLIEALEILEIDTQKLKIVYYFLDNYAGLNQVTKFMIDVLLELNLPFIDSRGIAKKIIENSKV